MQIVGLELTLSQSTPLANRSFAVKETLHLIRPFADGPPECLGSADFEPHGRNPCRHPRHLFFLLNQHRHRLLPIQRRAPKVHCGTLHLRKGSSGHHWNLPVSIGPRVPPSQYTFAWNFVVQSILFENEELQDTVYQDRMGEEILAKRITTEEVDVDFLSAIQP